MACVFLSQSANEDPSQRHEPDRRGQSVCIDPSVRGLVEDENVALEVDPSYHSDTA